MLFSILSNDGEIANIGTIRKGYTKVPKLLYMTSVIMNFLFWLYEIYIGVVLAVKSGLFLFRSCHLSMPYI